MKKNVLTLITVFSMLAVLISGCGESKKAGANFSIQDSGWEKEKEEDEVFHTAVLSSDAEEVCVLYYPTSGRNDHGYSMFLQRPSGTQISVSESELRDKTFSVLGGYRQDLSEIEKYGITLDAVRYEMEAYSGGNLYTVTQIIHSEQLPANTLCIVNIHCSNGQDIVGEITLDANGDGGFSSEFVDDAGDLTFETEYIRALVPDEAAKEQAEEVSWGEEFQVESVIQSFPEHYVEVLAQTGASGVGVINIGDKPIRMGITFINGTGVVSGVGLSGSAVALDSFHPFELVCDYQKKF